MAPYIFDISENQTYSRGDNVTLNCQVLGGPSLYYQWRFGGVDISGGNDSFLYLSNVNASHGGEYTCVVSNSAGNDTASTPVFISPYFITEPQDVFIASGSPLSVVCEAESFPAPMYQWARSDELAIRDQITGINSTTLGFDPLQFGDEGTYICTVTSQGITIQSVTTITCKEVLFVLYEHQ